MAPQPPARTFRRHLFFVAGYDPMTVDAHHRIFQRELARFAEVWGVSASADNNPRAVRTGGSWTARSHGPDWETETRFEILAWDDLVRADMNRSRWSHLFGTIRALGDMIATGTIFRYFRTSHRYGIFFCLTYLTLAAIWAVSAGIGWVAAHFSAPLVDRALVGTWIAGRVFLGQWVGAAFGVVVAIIAALVITRLLSKRLRLRQSLDLAEFSVDFVHDRHPDITRRITSFADRLRAVAAKGGVDEIVLAGHSLGAQHVISVIARALRDEPDLGTTLPIRILTLGSTTAKFALHPEGERLRSAARMVHKAEAIGWTEYQAKDDIVSFYKVDPVTLGPITDGDTNRRPLVRRVPIRAMLTPATYAKFRIDVMRLHCQFFLANDQRAPYDFYAFICAPVPYDVLVGTPEGPLAVFREDGSVGAPEATLAPEAATQQKGA
ncbi:hypothetical protein GCM10007301_11700 [Azorhizobium oxalatiphilum]|uniref:Uncharacterized protein n=1 Tax=Azorhizobium oxalatiphilum TaxID=980631 RepID=A0A917BTI0_9HYPH|nr:hypothetical protein [Azorhizobium oxalatiphilum]GGF53878.1 hypothetical protein GCM10007301_11700 [Azorhizobium oxalatiphilum]